MKSSHFTVFFLTIAVSFLSAGVSTGQELDEHLMMFHSLQKTVWTGHYVNSADSELVHTVRFEPILDGKVVRSTKDVAALNFKMETYYYWDWEKETIKFLRLTNRGIFSNGRLTQDGDIITLSGMGTRPGGVSEFKQTFELRSNGKLSDHFYRKEKDDWVKGHVIEYSRPEVANE